MLVNDWFCTFLVLNEVLCSFPSRLCVVLQLDLSTFVQRSGSTLTLGGAPFKFAGATNYYMLTRAADPATRHQVRTHAKLRPGGGGGIAGAIASQSCTAQECKEELG